MNERTRIPYRSGDALDYCNRIIKQGQLETTANQVVLDVGCGEGEICRRLCDFSESGPLVMGLDIRSHEAWKNYSRCAFIVGDALFLPFRDESFDLVYEKDTLHHVEKQLSVLSEIRRVANKAARIVAIEANRHNPLLFLHMTLLLGHNHLTQKRFLELMRVSFGHCSFQAIETHAWPVKSSFLKMILKYLEMILESIPLLTPYRAYNIGIVDPQVTGHQR